VILEIKQQTKQIKSFVFRLLSKKVLQYNPGQFFVFSLPGYGESVFVPADRAKLGEYDIAVARVGTVTAQFHRLKEGDTFGIRGPYGNGFDLKKFQKRPMLLIAGGLGIVPLRSLFAHLTHRYRNVFYDSPIQLFYGARSYGDLVFREEFKQWKKCLQLEVTLSKPHPDTMTGWRSHIGLVTTLFKKVDIVHGGVAILCGPPVMFKAVVPVLQRAGFKDEDIYLSLERRMECAGLGTCQHCAIGPYYVCKDGPVFTYAQLKNTVQYT